jgi:AraC family transcriptional regulator
MRHLGSKSSSTQTFFAMRELHPIKQINGRFLTIPDSFVLKNRGCWKHISANQLSIPEGEEFSACVDALALAVHFGAPVNLDWQWGDDKRYIETPVFRGSCHVQPSGVPYWSRWLEANSGDMLVILLEKSFLAQVLTDGGGFNLNQLRGQFGVRDRVLESFGQLFQAEVDSGSQANQLYIESLATAIVLHIYRYYSKDDRPIKDPSGGLSKSLLKEIHEYINENLSENVSLVELAALAKMSTSHFSRLFKQTFEQSPYQYITHCRIERAKKLLSQVDVRIADIPQQVGFYDQSQFTNAFRKSVGVTPKKYRSNL